MRLSKEEKEARAAQRAEEAAREREKEKARRAAEVRERMAPGIEKHGKNRFFPGREILEEERDIKKTALVIHQGLAGFKTVTLADGTLVHKPEDRGIMLGWELDRERQAAEAKEKARQEGIRSQTQQALASMGVLENIISIDVGDLHLENRGGELVIVSSDPWKE